MPPPAGVGRVVIGEPVELQNIVSAEEARKLAQAELKRRTAVSHKAQISVLPDPRRGPREDCRLNVRRPRRPDPDGFGYASGEPGKEIATGRWTSAATC